MNSLEVDKSIETMKWAVLTVALFGACLAAPALTPAAPSHLNGVVHGDLLLTPEQEAVFFGNGRTGITDTYYRWTDNIVPVELTDQTDEERLIVWEALRDMETKICIKFVARTTETDYVYITRSEAGCWSWVGRLGGAQQMNLDPECYAEVVVQHEMIHALGFFHMQSATDRDDFVNVIWENIIPGMEHNFDKVNADSTHQFDQPYDYYSIMHYPGWAFSANGEDTMVAVQAGVSLDYRWVMTDTDIRRIENMYCPSNQ